MEYVTGGDDGCLIDFHCRHLPNRSIVSAYGVVARRGTLPVFLATGLIVRHCDCGTNPGGCHENPRPAGHSRPFACCPAMGYPVGRRGPRAACGFTSGSDSRIANRPRAGPWLGRDRPARRDFGFSLAVRTQSDQRLQSSDWNLSAAPKRVGQRAKAERLPSLTLGGDYLMLSQQPHLALRPAAVTDGGLSVCGSRQRSRSYLVKQPLYTSGRISHGIDAAESAVKASQAEVDRTRLDIRMNVAEIYVNVLRATRIVGLAQSKVVSLTAHTRDVTSLLKRTGLEERSLVGPSCPGRCPPAVARCPEQPGVGLRLL